MQNTLQISCDFHINPMKKNPLGAHFMGEKIETQQCLITFPQEYDSQKPESVP